jgi:hypothetical protein
VRSSGVGSETAFSAGDLALQPFDGVERPAEPSHPAGQAFAVASQLSPAASGEPLEGRGSRPRLRRSQDAAARRGGHIWWVCSWVWDWWE